MLRISKMTDYGVVLASHMAGASRERPVAVRDLATETRIPQPTVSKVLKLLARGRLVESHRGARGGYRLARPPEDITIAEVIEVFEGPIAVTECSHEETSGVCDIEGSCEVQANWQRINAAVQMALSAISLAEMAAQGPELVSLARSAEDAARRRGMRREGDLRVAGS